MEELAEEIVVSQAGPQSHRGRPDPAVPAGGGAGSGTVDLDEVVSVFRLVGRRRDAGLVFADAGRRAARYAARGVGRPSRTLARVSPGGMSRRLAMRRVARLARNMFGGEMQGRSMPSR